MMEHERRRRLKNLRDRNRRFARMPRDRQRIAIARDVLAQLDIGRFEAASVYLQIRTRPLAEPHELHFKAAQAEIDLSEVTACADKCRVCGIGSVFVAAVERADRLKLAELRPNYDGNPLVPRQKMVDYLAPWFDGEQLGIIESVFEQGQSCPAAWLEFGPTKRLRRIMENIIENGGEFILPAEGE